MEDADRLSGLDGTGQDSATFSCLCFGRWDAEKVLESGRMLFAGDRELGRAIVRQMTMTP